MPTSTLRSRVQHELVRFAWGQWGQLGVLAPTARSDQVVADPEALLLFTFEAARDDPRLFDEVLDWLLANESWIGVQRLRNLCLDQEDIDLVEAALGWVARWQPRARFTSRHRRPEATEARLLFTGASPLVTRPDPAFAAVGLLKPDTEPSRKSRLPDPHAPIALAYRLRLLLGVGSRAEVVRVLLTSSTREMSAQEVANAVTYAKRNVSDTLAALAAAGALTSRERGNERRYAITREHWGRFLDLDPSTWPAHRDWPQVLRAMRLLRRWIVDPRLDDESPYMLASHARDLVGEIEGDLALVGVTVSATRGPSGERYWETFTDAVDRALASLDGAAPGQ